jgi:hypothetical protein
VDRQRGSHAVLGENQFQQNFHRKERKERRDKDLCCFFFAICVFFVVNSSSVVVGHAGVWPQGW